MSGQMLGGAVGTAIGNLRETTLNEARAEFDAKLGELTSARNRMTETADPEVFAFRTLRILEACRELDKAAYTLTVQATKATNK